MERRGQEHGQSVECFPLPLGPLGEGQGQREHRRGEEQHRLRETEETQPCGAHGHQFLIEGEPTEGGDRRDEPGHRKCQHQAGGKEHGDDL